MGRYLRIALLLVAVLLVTLSMLAWWFLRFDALDPPDLPGKFESGTLQHDGHARSWKAYLPTSRGEHPPLLLLLHGSRGSGDDMRLMSFYGFDIEAERAGYIAVYPDGYQRHWNGCRASADYAANTENIDDVGFLRALVAELVARYGADPQRVFAAGYSNGGHMAYRLALEAPDLVHGVAAFAASLPVPANLGCRESGEPVPVLMINGTEDPVNVYEGGLVEVFGDTSRGEVRSAVDTARYWAEVAGYGNAFHGERWPDKDRDDGTTVEVKNWQRPGMAPVQLIEVVGGGHTMPDRTFSLPRLLGPTSHEFNTAEVVWDFFSKLD